MYTEYSLAIWIRNSCLETLIIQVQAKPSILQLKCPCIQPDIELMHPRHSSTHTHMHI